MAENINSTILEEELLEQQEDSRETMIRIDDVSMIFNIASEQLNNLKEYFIAIAKHELTFKEFRALNHISFEIKKGDVFGIMGTNGSGKSTLLKIIAGVLEPSSGTCTVKGTIAPLIELGAGFDMDLTARENIYMNGSLLGYSKKFIDEHFDEIVDFAEVREFLDMPMKNYSSGMIVRVAFAVATVIVPDVLIVDEVLSVGDFMFQKKCEDRIQTLIEQHGVTVLIVSHSAGQIERLCNKAIWIEKGNTRLMGDAAKVSMIYAGLGGRRGSSESEQFIFDRLIRLAGSKPDERIDAHLMPNPSELSVNLASSGVEDLESIDTVVMAPTTTHLNGILATPIAGGLKAPILLPTANGLTPSLENLMFKAKPSKAVFLDCGGSAKESLDALHELPWDMEVVNMSGSGNVLEYSLHLARKQIGSEAVDEALVIEFADEVQSIALAPYIATARPTVICVRQSEGESDVDAIADFLGNSGITKATLVGSATKLTGELKAKEQVRGIEFEEVPSKESLFESAMEISNRFGGFADGSKTICLGSIAQGQRPYLAEIGTFCSRMRSKFVFVDLDNLDNMKMVLDFIQAGGYEQIHFIGNETAFSPLEMNLFASSMKGSEQEVAK